MPDTGASQSIVSADTARAANLCVWPTVTEMRNASNGVMTLLGEADIIMCNDKHSTNSTVLVASEVRPAGRKGGTPTLGWRHCPRLGARPFWELYAPSPPVNGGPV